MHPSRFSFAVMEGKVDEAVEILRTNPTVDVNWKNQGQENWAALHYACQTNRVSLVALLLAHPCVDVNLENDHRGTPFCYACTNGNTACVRLLPKDPRVIVREMADYGETTLRLTAFYGELDVLKWWIASGREVDLGEPGNDRTDAIDSAEKENRTDVVTLLKRFKEDPGNIRSELRVELGWYDELAAELFALIVFVSDGLLQTGKEVQVHTPAARFFAIANRLPLELQMVLCRVAAGRPQGNILTKHREPAFKFLAMKYFFWLKV